MCIQIPVLLVLVIMLSACSAKEVVDDTSAKVSGSNVTSVISTHKDYRFNVTDGKYETGAAREEVIANSTQSNGYFNIESMQSDLKRFSSGIFPSDKYKFSEGQLITNTILPQWLARKGNPDLADPIDPTYPTGLNPARHSNRSTRTPVIIGNIIEQNYIGKDSQLAGISIGIGVKSTDTYQKIQYGAYYEQKIKTTTAVKYGVSVSTIIAQRVEKLLRSKKQSPVPIFIGIYNLADTDELIGGTYVMHATYKNNKMSAWIPTNEVNQMLPVVESQKPISPDLSSQFNNFTKNIKQAFPKVPSITAQARFRNQQIYGLNCTVEAQYFGESEIQSLLGFVASAATNDLPESIPVEITIRTATGIVGYAGREEGESNFYVHVLTN
ncbi:CamS family sex pheromone protein [Lacticaseibacillus jixiensis]|uniref:CamS family sex pheromone protein n=1 Tax=Lacticaseibacillus jixiensis TaxID=3231926 RepID=UPI0036F20B74